MALLILICMNSGSPKHSMKMENYFYTLKVVIRVGINLFAVGEDREISEGSPTRTCGILAAVFEIKVLFCAPAGCKHQKNGAPGQLFMCYSLYKPI